MGYFRHWIEMSREDVGTGEMDFENCMISIEGSERISG